MSKRSYSLTELARLVDGRVVGDGTVEISGVAGIREAKSGEITFVANPKYAAYVASTAASAVIASPDLHASVPLIQSENPQFAYLKVIELFAEDLVPKYARTVHEFAVVDPSAILGSDVAIGPFCQVGAEARIGDHTTILSGTFVGQGVSIGSDCILYPNVTVREGTQIGDRVILQPGVVIGSDGFGFAKNGHAHHKVPQIGRVIIEDDVEIGANSCVDRATTGETIVRAGSKIDNLVQIAHNVVVGEHAILAAQAGISGSTELGRNVTLGGQAGVVGHVTIGDNAIVGARGAVTKSVPENTTVSGYPAREHSVARKIWAHSARLPEMARRLRELERLVDELRREKGIPVDSSATDD